MHRTLVWFRRDLRLSDHAPIHRAARRGQVIPVFILDRSLLQHPETGSARVQFMLACLRCLDQDLRQRGGRLILRSGDPVQVLPPMLRETQAEGIYAYLDYERIYGRIRDARLNQALAQHQMQIRWFEPEAGTPDLIPYPQYRDLWFARMQEPLLPTPRRIQVPAEIPSEPWPQLEDLGLIQDIKPMPWAGTETARQLLHQFIQHKADRYYWQLSYPSASVTTGLGPHLKFGVISVRECFQTLQPLQVDPDARVRRSGDQVIARLRWGSGFHQRFRYLPQLEIRSLYSIFDQEGWAFEQDLYQAWQEGRTGFPIVDAAARCLRATGGIGELNFRTRALYASFLTNLLGIDWRYGALHFMQHLIDGDCPIDHYQWAMQAGVTHCVDKSWTRIYNPEQTAVDRCDPQGLFIKRWVPELADLPPEHLGSPPPLSDYPDPIVSYSQARRQRVLQLERQRQSFRHQADLVPHLARLPRDLTPFGADRVPCDVTWVQTLTQTPSLWPAALDLDSLDPRPATQLRTWFVAHLQIPPRPPSRASQRSRRPPSPHPDQPIQLHLSV